MATKYVRGDRKDRIIVTVINQVVTLANELKADHNGAMTKLDADAGVTDTNYSSLRAIAAPDADTLKVVW
jgi:hypothetical protein